MVGERSGGDGARESGLRARAVQHILDEGSQQDYDPFAFPVRRVHDQIKNSVRIAHGWRFKVAMRSSGCSPRDLVVCGFPPSEQGYVSND